MGPAIGLYVGRSTSFNVENDVRNMGWMLADEFDLHLVTTADLYEAEPFVDYFDVHGTDRRAGVAGDRRALASFLRTADPDVLVNVTHPPVHGTELGVVSLFDDVEFVFRYPGANYSVFRAARRGWRVGYFLMNNCVGRLPPWLADRVIAMEPRDATQLVRRGVPEDRIAQLPPPVDGDRFRDCDCPPAGVEIPQDRSVVLFVGRLTRLKGIEVLERTIPRILDHRPDLQFLFVGRGDRSIDLPDRWADHVSVVGSVPTGRVPEYFARADLVVLPSLVEGFGRVLVEALFSDTPVVARAVGNVDTITRNTFRSESEFVEMVRSFESLPVDDPREFGRRALKPRYVRTFRSVAPD